MAKAKRTAYLYSRFSDKVQAKGSSLARQREAEKLIHEKGWKLDTTLNLKDLGVSAFKGKNATIGKLSEFLKQVKLGRIKSGSVFVVEHLDRLSRAEITTAQSIFLDIINAGISIVTTIPEYKEYSKKLIDDNPFMIMEIVMLFVAANDFSKKLSKRVKDSWTIRRATGKPAVPKRDIGRHGRYPAWLTLNRKSGEYELDTGKVNIVKRIIQMTFDGMGAQRISRLLNEEGVPSISSQSTTWANQFVIQLLESVALYGACQQGHYVDGKRRLGELKEGFYPPIITKEKYLQMQMLRKSRGGGRVGRNVADVANLFSGLMIEPSTGEKYHKITKHRDDARIAPSSFRDGGMPLSFPFNPLESFLLRVISDKISLEDIQGNAIEQPVSDVDALRGKLAETDAKIGKLNKAMLESPDITLLIEQTKLLDAKRNELREAIDTAESKIESKPAKELTEIREYMKEGDRQKLQAGIRRLVSEIRMVITGIKNSPFKAIDCQIYFRAGGAVMVSLGCEVNRPIASVGIGVEEISPEKDMRNWPACAEWVERKKKQHLLAFKLLCDLRRTDRRRERAREKAEATA